MCGLGSAKNHPTIDLLNEQDIATCKNLLDDFIKAIRDKFVERKRAMHTYTSVQQADFYMHMEIFEEEAKMN